jgi:hypothetical protein
MVDPARIDGQEWSAASSGSTSDETRSISNLFAALAYSFIMAVVLVISHLWLGTDYVGHDNDDVMRLVEVRDLLNGQDFLDLNQYRLGLAGGTLMHWSRLIDVPIASLILLFRSVTSPEQAEALALAVWPLSLAAATVWLVGLAARRAGGVVAMHLASCMAILYVYTMGRFGVGSIDHHNAQITLAALVLAMLADPLRQPQSFAIAGAAAGVSLAIGAETVPFVAALCLFVASRWALCGEAHRASTTAFCSALLLSITAAFFATTRPSLYGMVTCDNLSLGLYAAGSMGGALLVILASFASRLSKTSRLLLLCVVGAMVLVTIRVIAPQCLGSPLAELDPMLAELWLGKVVEAKSFFDLLREQPALVGGYYGVGFLALAVCAARILRREKAELHAMLLCGLVAVLVVAMVQVRGAMYSNLLAILPLALLATDLRNWQQAQPRSPLRAVTYMGSIIVSIPIVWSLTGVLTARGIAVLGGKPAQAAPVGISSCITQQALAPLAAEPPGVVMAPSDIGVSILRYTPHRVLSAPYHRNQGGMLTELNAGLSVPEETIAFLRGASVTHVVFCPTEVQTRDLARMKPDGFYAALSRGEVPPYLVPISGSQGALRIFRVNLDQSQG